MPHARLPHGGEPPTDRMGGVALGRELGSLRIASIDPRADSIAKLATLLGFDGERTKAVVSAVDPWALPVWLELASIVFLSAAFQGRNREQLQTVAPNSQEILTVAFTRDAALRDFRSLKDAPAQRFLSERW